MTYANDNLANALAISGDLSFGPVAWPGSPAPTIEPGESVFRGTRTIWFAWAGPPSDTVATVTVNTWDSPSTGGGTGGVDTWIRVYSTTVENPGFADLVQIAFNDDNGNLYAFNSAVTFTAPSGSRYYFQVGNFSDFEEGTLFFNFIASIVQYHWSEWRYPPPIVAERIHDYTFGDTRWSGLPDTYANRATGSVDSSNVLPYVSGIPTQDSWVEEYSTRVVHDGASPGSVETFYTTVGASGSAPTGEFLTETSGNSQLLTGGGIGGMWVMGRHGERAWPLDMLSRLTYGQTPDDPDYAGAAGIEFGIGDLISAQFVIQSATSYAFSEKENVDTSSANFDEAYYTDNPLLLTDLAAWTTVDIVSLPDTAWAGSRRHPAGDFPPLGQAIRPFDQMRNDANIGTVLTTLDPPVGSDPVEHRYLNASDLFGYTGYWHNHPDYASPIYTTLGADSCLVIAAVPRAYSLGRAPQPSRDALQTFPSGYHPGAQYLVSLADTQGTTTPGDQPAASYIGWVATWQPPPYRLLLPGPGTPPPLRQWQRSDTSGRAGQVTTNQASLRRGVANSYL